MAKAKKKLLPKDFEVLLKAGDLAVLKAVFDDCLVDARGGVFKETAIAFNDCPDDLTRWLVEQGADLAAPDSYGDTPLHARAGHWQGRIEILLELGADVHHEAGGRGTPLHQAAQTGNGHTARLLLTHGASADARDAEGQTPLIRALSRCRNSDIEKVAAMAELLLDASSPPPPPKRTLTDRLLGRQPEPASRVTPEMQGHVHRIGTDFEFHRAGFNPDYVDETSAALERLYALFHVPPVPRRAMHDGKSPIAVTGARWEDHHQALWELLVPSSGAAATVQGEVIRISGRISDELDGNGGINWDVDYRKMADAFLAHMGAGKPLPDAALDEARSLIPELKAKRGDPVRLCALAVEWVGRNPKPIPLPPPDYRR